MARSHYIYVVTDGAQVVGAFTVKYEMEEWCRDNERLPKFRVFRFKDGKWQKPYDCARLELGE